MPDISRFDTLQALRVVAAFAVVALHACFYVQEALGVPTPNLRLFGEGGVWLFFAISGFVMLLVTDRHPKPTAGSFVIARIARVVPLAWVMTTIALVIGVLDLDLNHPERPGPLRIVASYLFLPTESPSGLVQPVWNVGWTLVFEMAFYLLVTLAIALRIDPLRLVSPVLVLAATASFVRPSDGGVWWFYADPIVLSFLVGMLTARLVLRGRGRLHLALSVATTALVVAATWRAEGRVEAVTTGATFAVVVATMWIAVVSEPRVRPFLPTWLLRGGDASYALYLSHPLVGTVFVALLAPLGIAAALPMPVLVIATVIVAVSVAPAVHRWVDRPLCRWTGRVLTGRTATGIRRHRALQG